jgi:hypothetical protein
VPTELITILPLIASVLGALGIGSVIGQWIAGGKDRRAARAAVLEKLQAVEVARWLTDDKSEAEENMRLRAAGRELEIAALVARVPRAAVIPYVQLAPAGLWILHGKIEHGEHPDDAWIQQDMSDAVRDAAEIVSKAAWSSRPARRLWLPWRLRATRRAIDNISDSHTRAMIEAVSRFVR